MTQQTEILAVRIGQGEKLHPAFEARGGFMFCCGCPGTANGRANHKATVFRDQKPNCRGA